MGIEFCPSLLFQSVPGIFFGDADISIVGRLPVFFSHFKEYEVGQLFQIISVAHAPVPEDVAETPDFGNDG